MTTATFLVPRRDALPTAVRGWSEFDRLFDGLWKGVAAPTSERAWTPRVDVTETEAEFRVEAELPGLEEKDIDVSLEDGVLTLSGERVAASEDSDAAGRHFEIRRGRFHRAIRLPTDVDADAVKAVYRSGILNVTLPKAPGARVRSIPITA